MNAPANNLGPTTALGRSKRALVLVVDDVEGNRQLLCRRLEPFGYDMYLSLIHI